MRRNKKLNKEIFLLNSLEQTFKECTELVAKKNRDYSGSNVDEFANFKACEILGISAEQGILIRWLDKLMRINNLLTTEAHVEDETIKDTLKDSVNYPALLLALLESRKDKKTKKGKKYMKRGNIG